MNIKISKITTALLVVLLMIIAITLSLGCIDNSPAGSELEKDDETNPGFEGIFAVAGLLAIAYLILRQREDEKKDNEKDKEKDNKRGHS